MQAAICNDTLGLRICVNVQSLQVSINGSSRSLRDEREAELLFHLFDRLPNILRFENIDELILHKHQVGKTGGESDRQYIHNKISALRRFFNEALNGHELIRNIRGTGYKLAEGWRKEEIGYGLAAQIHVITSIVNEAIALSDSLPILNTGDDQKEVLVLGIDSHESEVADLRERYTQAADQLSDLLPLATIDQDFIAIIRLLQTIESYVAMQRSGSGIDDVTWKRTYREELTMHLATLTLVLQTSFLH
jgi:DNA-binding winged helix-turn-helix (wHTH) protein